MDVHIEEAEYGRAVYFDVTNSGPLKIIVPKAGDAGL